MLSEGISHLTRVANDVACFVIYSNETRALLATTPPKKQPAHGSLSLQASIFRKSATLVNLLNLLLNALSGNVPCKLSSFARAKW